MRLPWCGSLHTKHGKHRGTCPGKEFCPRIWLYRYCKMLLLLSGWYSQDYLHFLYSLIRMCLYRLFYVWYLFLMLGIYLFLFCNFTNCMQLRILNSEIKILLINKYTVISFKQCIIFFAELSWCNCVICSNETFKMNANYTIVACVLYYKTLSY